MVQEIIFLNGRSIAHAWLQDVLVGKQVCLVFNAQHISGSTDSVLEYKDGVYNVGLFYFMASAVDVRFIGQDRVINILPYYVASSDTMNPYSRYYKFVEKE